jgi:hypothetical protein
MCKEVHAEKSRTKCTQLPKLWEVQTQLPGKYRSRKFMTIYLQSCNPFRAKGCTCKEVQAR